VHVDFNGIRLNFEREVILRRASASLVFNKAHERTLILINPPHVMFDAFCL
jgi:hypothetical protein